MRGWATRLKHDLLKPALWAAADARADGLLAAPALAAAILTTVDEEGRALRPSQLWARFREEAPPLPAVLLDAFETAVHDAEALALAPTTGADSLLTAIDALAALHARLAAAAAGG